MSRSRSASPRSSIRRGRASMPSAVLHERSPLHGLAAPGHHGRASVTGLTIVERSDIAFANIIARRGKRDALVAAAQETLGVVLPAGPHRVSKAGMTFAGVGPDQWIASTENTKGFPAALRERIGAFAAVS